MKQQMNLGSGPDIKQGWLNVDSKDVDIDEAIVWDAREPMPFKDWEDNFDFVLVNHVLCTMDYSDVSKVLDNIYKILKPGGTAQIIDMDLNRAFKYYQNHEAYMIPASGSSLDEKFCNHISGFGTRKSLYTKNHLVALLRRHGFTTVCKLSQSEHDLRPNESLIVEATK